MSYQSELPSIMITADDLRRLSLLANSSMTRFPGVAQYLAEELDRANVVPAQSDLEGVVRMGSLVTYRDETTGRVREVTLVYPHEADLDLNRISVLESGWSGADRLVGWSNHRLRDANTQNSFADRRCRFWVTRLTTIDVRSLGRANTRPMWRYFGPT